MLKLKTPDGVGVYEGIDDVLEYIGDRLGTDIPRAIDDYIYERETEIINLKNELDAAYDRLDQLTEGTYDV